MSYPILFNPDAQTFDNNGLGILTGATRCIITEERNGLYELEMSYPVDGIHYSEIRQRSILHACGQPFRVYRITKPLNCIATVYARHISYDLAGVVVSPCSADNAPAALTYLVENSTTEHPFGVWTDLQTVSNWTLSVPTGFRAALGGSSGSILDRYGGEYEWDGYLIKLHGQRGTDRGVCVEYGRNLTSLTQDESCANVYTGVYPYWTDADGNLVQLPEKIVHAEGDFGFDRIMTLDLSAEWTEQPPTEEQLRIRAASYIRANRIGVPDISLDVSYEQLDGEIVTLCDTVAVRFPALGVTASAKCVRTEYNVLLDRIVRITLGNARPNIVDTIVQQSTDTAQKIEAQKTALQKAVDRATSLITGASGGTYVQTFDPSGHPDGWAVLTSTGGAWRMSAGGLGYSETGLAGPYRTAITADGQIVADFITAGTLTASVIDVVNLIVQHLRSSYISTAGEVALEATGAVVKLTLDGSDTAVLETMPDSSGRLTVAGNGETATLTPSQLTVAAARTTNAQTEQLCGYPLTIRELRVGNDIWGLWTAYSRPVDEAPLPNLDALLQGGVPMTGSYGTGAKSAESWDLTGASSVVLELSCDARAYYWTGGGDIRVTERSAALLLADGSTVPLLDGKSEYTLSDYAPDQLASVTLVGTMAGYCDPNTGSAYGGGWHVRKAVAKYGATVAQSDIPTVMMLGGD